MLRISVGCLILGLFAVFSGAAAHSETSFESGRLIFFIFLILSILTFIAAIFSENTHSKL